MTSEFELIQRFFTKPAPNAVLGVGDDCALVEPTPGMQLALSTDALVAGVHFFADVDPFKLGHKALAVNLSDLAAMGATPRWALLAITVAEADDAWLQAFAAGFFTLAERHGVALIGGDTTRGPMNICVQVIGEVPTGQALRRDGARPGDDIWVSGQLGDAALALANLQHRVELTPHEAALCQPALYTPMSRIALGERLRGIAHSAIDISDGLVADLGHILERSGVAAVVEFAALPTSEVLSAQMANSKTSPVARDCILAGGDDYELCFTAPLQQRAALHAIAAALELKLTRIGEIQAGSGLRVIGSAGDAININKTGFDHFG